MGDVRVPGPPGRVLRPESCTDHDGARWETRSRCTAACPADERGPAIAEVRRREDPGALGTAPAGVDAVTTVHVSWVEEAAVTAHRPTGAPLVSCSVTRVDPTWDGKPTPVMDITPPPTMPKDAGDTEVICRQAGRAHNSDGMERGGFETQQSTWAHNATEGIGRAGSDCMCSPKCFTMERPDKGVDLPREPCHWPIGAQGARRT